MMMFNDPSLSARALGPSFDQVDSGVFIRQPCPIHKISASGDLSAAIGEPHRFEAGLLEPLEPGSIRYFGIETAATEPPVFAFDGAVVDDVVPWRGLATTVATDLIARCGFESVHAE